MNYKVSLVLHAQLNHYEMNQLINHFYVAVLLCWVTLDFELYAAFDPLADKVRLLPFYKIYFLFYHIYNANALHLHCLP